MSESTSISAGRTVQLIALSILILGLYFARDILIPIALAILISFLLYPLVRRQTRWGFPLPVAIGVVVTLSALAAGTLGYVVLQQAYSLGQELPKYRENLIAKARSLRDGGATVHQLTATIEGVKQELAATQPATEPGIAAQLPIPPAMRVKLVDAETDYLDTIASVAEPLLHPVATIGMVLLMTIFILLGADELRDRLIWLAGTRQISLTTSVLDDVGITIGRFLRTQLLVNASYGVMTCISMWIIGVPNALLWGLLGGLLRYVPFVGAWIALSLPLLISIATSATWSQPILVLLVFLSCEFLVNGFIEPLCYSGSTGMTAWGVVLSTFFWGWLWGPVGLILSVPLTTCLIVIGKYVPQFSFFTRFLGSGDVLPVEGRLYQRLLVWDEAGAEGLLKSELDKENASPESLADELFIPVLQTLKRDIEADIVTQEHAALFQQITDQLDEFGPFLSDDIIERPTILLLSGPTRADEIASHIMARMMILKGFSADIVRSAKLASEAVQRVAQAQPLVVAVVQAGPISPAHAVYLIKLVCKSEQDLRVVFIGLQSESINTILSKRITLAGATKCFSRFSDVLRYLADLQRIRKHQPDESTQTPEKMAI